MDEIKIVVDVNNAWDIVAKCREYKRLCDIDVVCGRTVVDGCSQLGVLSLAGREVIIRPITDDLVLKDKIRDSFSALIREEEEKRILK